MDELWICLKVYAGIIVFCLFFAAGWNAGMRQREQ